MSNRSLPVATPGSTAVHVIDDVLDETAARAAYDELRDLTLPGDCLFVRTEVVRAHKRGDGAPHAELSQYVSSKLATTLLDYIAALYEKHVPAAAGSVAGFEVWVNQFRINSRKQLHVDYDGALRRKTNEVRTPAWSTILHLGPERGMRGGETAIFTARPAERHVLDACFTSIEDEEVLALSNDRVVVPQKFNRLVVFDGSLPHYVMPVKALADATQPRVTMTVNLWDAPILAAARRESMFPFAPQVMPLARLLDTNEISVVAELAQKLSAAQIAGLFEVVRAMNE
jgi:hypothetical protein